MHNSSLHWSVRTGEGVEILVAKEINTSISITPNNVNEDKEDSISSLSRIKHK